jgi:glutamate synthase domain-containing protein 2
MTAALAGALAVTAACLAVPHGEYALAMIGVATLALAARDYWQRHDPLLRNYPVVGRLHGLLHLAGKLFGLRQPLAPYSWATIELVQERAAGRGPLSAFGAQHPVSGALLHAVSPAETEDVPERIVIGAGCAKPYAASYLNISALAFGAISERAIETLSRGAHAGGFYYNTGEAGLPEAFLQGGGDLVWQLGTGYFGCRDRAGRLDEGAFRERASLPAVKMIEIKLSQGSKPAKGGLLPAEKVTRRVAEVCQISHGQPSVLPATHSAFSTPSGLMELVARLREASGGKPVGVKLCLGRSADVFAMVKAMVTTGIAPDYIAIDGAEGGTGAAPVEFQSFVGVPLARALPLVRDALLGCGLRERVRVIASGKVTTGADMVMAVAAGADLCAAARPFLLALGCMQALICASNQCPVGLTTQHPRLTRGIVPEAQAIKVMRYHQHTVLAFRELVAAAGCRSPTELDHQHVLGAPHWLVEAQGQLLAGEVPQEYATAWAKADPGRW